VGVNVVRELYGVMAAQGAASGIVVTSGSFTPDTVDFASGRNIQLIAGRELHELIRGVRAAEPLPTGMTAERAQGNSNSSSGCPVCGSPMVRRTAKRGAKVGEAFYGCSRFPVCRGTRPVS
jgi:restriction system protein